MGKCSPAQLRATRRWNNKNRDKIRASMREYRIRLKQTSEYVSGSLEFAVLHFGNALVAAESGRDWREHFRAGMRALLVGRFANEKRAMPNDTDMAEIELKIKEIRL